MQITARLLQFSLAALMEMVTICAVLFALSGLIGLAASVCLILLAVALAARLGLAAVFMLCVASLSVEFSGRTSGDYGFFGLILIYAISILLCHWFRLRRPLLRRPLLVGLLLGRRVRSRLRLRPGGLRADDTTPV